MTRQEKYPDTQFFHYHNANPKKRITTDCVVRAITAAAEIDYNIVVLAQALVQIETGYDQAENKGIDILMSKLGWEKRKQPRKADGTKYTGREFCEMIQQAYTDGFDQNNERIDEDIVVGCRIIANIGGSHTAAIIDGKVWDTWDSTSGCVGNYWIKW